MEDIRDDSGELFSERPPHGPCQGIRCTETGHRMLDPYKADLYGEREWVYLCGFCEQEAMDAI